MAKAKSKKISAVTDRENLVEIVDSITDLAQVSKPVRAAGTRVIRAIAKVAKKELPGEKVNMKTITAPTMTVCGVTGTTLVGFILKRDEEAGDLKISMALAAA